MSPSSCHRFIELFLQLNFSCFAVDVGKMGVCVHERTGFYSILMNRLQFRVSPQEAVPPSYALTSTFTRGFNPETIVETIGNSWQQRLVDVIGACTPMLIELNISIPIKFCCKLTVMDCVSLFLAARPRWMCLWRVCLRLKRAWLWLQRRPRKVLQLQLRRLKKESCL